MVRRLPRTHAGVGRTAVADDLPVRRSAGPPVCRDAAAWAATGRAGRTPAFPPPYAPDPDPIGMASVRAEPTPRRLQPESPTRTRRAVRTALQAATARDRIRHCDDDFL